MPQLVVKPDATTISQLASGGAATIVGGGTVHGNLSDASGTTGVIGYWINGSLQDVIIPAGGIPKWIQVNVFGGRNANPPGGNTVIATVSTHATFGGLQSQDRLDFSSSAGVFGNRTGTLQPCTDISQLFYEIFPTFYGPPGSTSGVAFDAYFGALSVTVTYALPPSTTVSAPSGTISSPTPTVSFVHTPGADGSVQSDYEYKLFTAAQYGVGGFNPDTSAYSHTGVGTTATSFVTPSLTNNTTYRAYVRTAQTINGFVQWGQWAFTQFAISQKPSTSAWTPIGVQPWPSGSKTFGWGYSHPNPAKTQKDYRLIVYRAADDSVYFDTTKTASTTHSHVRTSWEAITEPTQYYWTVQVWDLDDVASDVSSPQFLTLVEDPLVLVSNPTSGESFIAGFSVTWAIDIGTTPLSQTNQAAFRIIFYNDGEVLTDTGWLGGQDASYTPPSYSIFSPGDDLAVEVRLRDNNSFEGTSELIPFSVAWPLPVAATNVSVNVTQADVVGNGFVVVNWDSDVADPDFVEWRIYRRIVPSGPWVLAGTDDRASEGDISFNDYSFLNSVDQEWAVVQAATDFGQILESPYTATDTGTPESTYYWLADSLDPDGYTVRLDQTVSDTFVPEFERFESHVLGRGRRVEIGDYLGIRGSLTVHYREATTVMSENLRALEAIQLRKTKVWVRTPFARTILCYLADYSITRLPGVGAREMVDVTIPYTEIG